MKISKPRYSIYSLLFNQSLAVVSLLFLFFYIRQNPKFIAFISKSELILNTFSWILQKLNGLSLFDFVLFFIVLVTYFIFLNLNSARFKNKRENLNQIFSIDTKWEKAIAVYLVFTSSLIEEFIFRGVLLGFFSNLLNPFFGIVISSVFFGLIHIEKNIIAQIFVVVLALILSGILFVGGSLWTCVAIHFIINIMAFFIPKKLKAVY